MEDFLFPDAKSPLLRATTTYIYGKKTGQTVKTITIYKNNNSVIFDDKCSNVTCYYIFLKEKARLYYAIRNTNISWLLIFLKLQQLCTSNKVVIIVIHAYLIMNDVT